MSSKQGMTDGLIAGYFALPHETQIFIAIIVTLAIWFHLSFKAETISHGPTILTTMGIFATFFGIAQGLAQFDTTHLQTGVPSLLAGLKTAFWASVVGVGLALTLKLREYAQLHFAPGRSSDTQDDVTAADLVKHLKHIHFALVGGNDGSLVSQVKLLRQDSNDRLDALRKAQVEALSVLSEMSSKTLVEALKDVIRDFNERITDQFGDNFKQLNFAVGNLLTWQEQYKRQIETTIVQLDDVARSSAKAAQDYATVLRQSGEFSQIATGLGLTLESLNAQKQQLVVVSDQLAKLLLSASDSLPEVEKKVLQLTTDLSNAVSNNQKTLNDALTTSSRSISELVGKTKEQIKSLDDALSEELTKSLNGLGTQLATLSSKFVSDYEPLTEKLHNLIHGLARPLQ